MIKIKPC